MFEKGDWVTYKDAEGDDPPRGRLILFEGVKGGEPVWLVGWERPNGEQRLKVPERSLRHVGGS